MKKKNLFFLKLFMILFCSFFNGKFIPSTSFINFTNLFNKLLHSKGHLLKLQDDFKMIVVKWALSGAFSSTHRQNELYISVSVAAIPGSNSTLGMNSQL